MADGGPGTPRQVPGPPALGTCLCGGHRRRPIARLPDCQVLPRSSRMPCAACGSAAHAVMPPTPGVPPRGRRSALPKPPGAPRPRRGDHVEAMCSAGSGSHHGCVPRDDMTYFGVRRFPQHYTDVTIRFPANLRPGTAAAADPVSMRQAPTSGRRNACPACAAPASPPPGRRVGHRAGQWSGHRSPPRALRHVRAGWTGRRAGWAAPGHRASPRPSAAPCPASAADPPAQVSLAYRVAPACRPPLPPWRVQPIWLAWPVALTWKVCRVVRAWRTTPPRRFRPHRPPGRTGPAVEPADRDPYHRCRHLRRYGRSGRHGRHGRRPPRLAPASLPRGVDGRRHAPASPSPP